MPAARSAKQIAAQHKASLASAAVRKNNRTLPFNRPETDLIHARHPEIAASMKTVSLGGRARTDRRTRGLKMREGTYVRGQGNPFKRNPRLTLKRNY